MNGPRPRCHPLHSQRPPAGGAFVTRTRPPALTPGNHPESVVLPLEVALGVPTSRGCDKCRMTQSHRCSVLGSVSAATKSPAVRLLGKRRRGRMWGDANLIHRWRACKTVQPLQSTQCGSFLRPRHVELLRDPAAPLLRIYPMAVRVRVHHKRGPGFLLGMMMKIAL